ncbi:gephyrin-like molybdotransferase receptor GlpR [uncultured Corynebacterium sp.]|uniref:divisome protein SepX/GlpR n=1 Tax=uncultured Corynebacterium sp. TaxID=159447 RepID=UPI0025E9E8D7|nr:gephyrin-like molybdotransferase receptor GlpR [uncultured Corynebacterium sp.]
MGSPSLMIILILVVWIIVLAPLMIGNNKPIRRSGDGYDETRVLHEGGTAPMAERRRPKLTAADIHRHNEDTDYEVVEATEAEEQVLIDDAPALRTIFRRPGADENAAAADHIDGEVIEHVDDEAESAESEGGSTKITASESAGSTSVKVLAAEDAAEDTDAEDDPENADADAENADADADEAEADRYELDESYTAPEDFGYAGETGGVEKQSAPEDINDEDDEDDTAEAAEAGDEDLAFAAARRGRGGFDPEREKKNTATRFQRRQRTLLALIAACVVTFVIAFVAGGWTWVLPAVAVGLTAWFMIALRRVVLQERALHARRLRQLRRARMGVAMSNHTEHPRDARLRAGSVVLDLDDDSPDFDTLPSTRYVPDNDPGYDDYDGYDNLGGYGTRAS